MPRFARGNRGFTLIEVMVATSLLTLVVGSIFVLVSDYSVLFRQAQERNVFMTLRRRIVQNLNRRDAWVVTYQTDPSFQCLLNLAVSCPLGKNNITATDVPFTVYSNRYPPTSQSIIFSNFVGIAENPQKGFTSAGTPCTTFNENAPATDLVARRCPIRLEVTWTLVNMGIPSQYYPMGYFPSGFYQNVGPGQTYYPGAVGTYFWFGTLGAQIEVRGRFFVHKATFGKSGAGANLNNGQVVNMNNYDFKLIKQVP